jgi:DNA repair exonuclease SbcCD nuclease subunit
MKILLTADLHLKSRHPFSRLVVGKMWDRMCQEKLKVVSLLPKVADKYEVDLVVIAGDIFDTSNPPESLKAEFVKILMAFNTKVVVITGRPGDHDYVSENNFVLMDIMEAFRDHENIIIHNSNFYPLPDSNILIYHDMLSGISDLYKKTIPLDHEKFRPFKTILMGDYHASYVKKYADKTFIYPGTPYPTRYGEDCHNISIVETNTKGEVTGHQSIPIKTYKLLECDSLKDRAKVDVPYVIKYKINCEPNELSDTLRELESIKRQFTKEDDSNLCMDVVWQVSTSDKVVDIKSNNNSNTLKEVCLDYIQNNAGNLIKQEEALFLKLEKEVE